MALDNVLALFMLPFSALSTKSKRRLKKDAVYSGRNSVSGYSMMFMPYADNIVAFQCLL